jgi:Zn-dependent protease with chaperone function
MLGKLITKEGEPEDKCAENGALMVLALLFIVVGIYCSWVIGSFIVNWAKTIL